MSEPIYGKSVLEQKIFSALDIQELANDCKSFQIKTIQQKEIIQGLLQALSKIAHVNCNCAAPAEGCGICLDECNEIALKAISKAQERKP